MGTEVRPWFLFKIKKNYISIQILFHESTAGTICATIVVPFSTHINLSSVTAKILTILVNHKIYLKCTIKKLNNYQSTFCKC